MISKLPYEYEIEINCLLRKVHKDFSPKLPTQRSERVLMKKLDEVYNLSNSTGNEEYKKIFNESFKRYNQIINEEVPKNNNLIKLKDMLSDSTIIHPEEMEVDLLMWRKSLDIIDWE